MRQIYDEVKTPFKYGVVLAGSTTNELVDCPSVFRSGGQWYMMYVAISNQVGYQINEAKTAVAFSQSAVPGTFSLGNSSRMIPHVAEVPST